MQQQWRSAAHVSVREGERPSAVEEAQLQRWEQQPLQRGKCCLATKEWGERQVQRAVAAVQRVEGVRQPVTELAVRECRRLPRRLG